MLSAPLIPYITLPELTLLPAGAFGSFPPAAISLKPFGLLVATGVYFASYLTLRRARLIGLDVRVMTSFITWVVGFGFIGGHVFDLIFYYPQRLLSDPWSLLRVWDGLSSFGGFTGGCIAMVIWRFRHGVSVLPYADNMMALFPVGWAFGRAGCASVHDHPGVLSDSWLAVRFPGGGRYDLGLLELLVVIPLAVAFLVLGRRRRPWGFFLALGCICYAPLRFALDFLREREVVPGDVHGAIDPRYGHLTPAQWECFALLGLGILVMYRLLGNVARGQGLEKPPVPATFQPAPESASSGSKS